MQQNSASPNYFILTEDATITPTEPRTRVTRRSPRTGELNTITINVPKNELNRWLENEYDYTANLPALHNAFPQLTPDDVQFIQYGFTSEDSRIFAEEENQAYARAAHNMRVHEYS